MFDRQRIRRPRQAELSPFAIPQSVRDLDPVHYGNGAAAGHDFGRIAVSPPTSPAPVTHTVLEDVQSFGRELSVSIRRAPPSGEQQEMASTESPRALQSADAGPGGETQQLDPNAQTEQPPTAGQTPNIPEPAEGERVNLPDIVVPLSFATTDAVASTLAYASKNSEEATDPGGGNFGLTTMTAPTVKNILVTPFMSTYLVTALLESPIKVQVRATTGPDGQVDIDGDSDADITSANYGTVVSDLTPDASDLSGRPPRTKFWAHDLTVKHERFHQTEYGHYGQIGTTQAQAWLNTQAAGSVADVNNLLNQLPNKVIQTVIANMSPPDVEKRAYADGSASYTARANAIKTKGDAHKYPAPAAGP